MSAWVEAGIPGIENAYVTMIDDMIEIELPHATILDMKLTEVKFGARQQYWPRSNIENLENSAVERVKGQVIRDAIENDKILDSVELKIRQQLEEHLRSLGFKEIVQISFCKLFEYPENG